MVSATQDSSESNIWLAASDGDLPRVRSLIESGVSPNALDSNAYSALHAAASWGHPDILRFLVHEAGANVNLTDGDGETCLFVVEDVEVARLLVEELGADTSVRNTEGRTAAEHIALENEHPDVASYLSPLSPAPLHPPTTGPPTTAPSADMESSTSALLAQVEQIMTECEAQGIDAEQRLREVVGEAVLQQLWEGERIGREEEEAGTGGAGRRERVGDDAGEGGKRRRED